MPEDQYPNRFKLVATYGSAKRIPSIGGLGVYPWKEVPEVKFEVERKTMPKNKADDPFGDDPWGPQGATETPDGEMPEPSVDPDRAPFLKPFHLSQREGTFELAGASGGTEYSDVVLHIKVGKRDFRLGLRTFDPAYKACVVKYGKKREDWHGTLMYRIMPHKGRADGFVAVRPK